MSFKPNMLIKSLINYHFPSSSLLIFVTLMITIILLLLARNNLRDELNQARNLNFLVRRHYPQRLATNFSPDEFTALDWILMTQKGLGVTRVWPKTDEGSGSSAEGLLGPHFYRGILFAYVRVTETNGLKPPLF